MLVKDIVVEEGPAGSLLTASVIREGDGLTRRLEYRFHNCPLDLVSTRGDAFVAGLLLPAMRAGENLTIQAPVSTPLKMRAEEITQELAGSRRSLSPVDVLAPTATSPERGSAIGLFFSGGIDSYYSLLKNLEEHPTGDDAITHLIFVFGIDTRYGYGQDYMDRVSQMIEEVAEETGKRAIILECNLRTEIPDTSWTIYHGSALISIALTLSPLLRRCVLATGLVQGRPVPWGSHPHIAPRWSSETLEIVHDGTEARRTEKVASRIARSELALRTLRVCFEVEQQPKNCGLCDKCLQSMLALHAAGALESCSTFVAPLDVKRVRRIDVQDRRFILQWVLDALGKSGYDRRLARAIKFALWKFDLKQAVKRGLSHIPRGGRPAHQPD